MALNFCIRQPAMGLGVTTVLILCLVMIGSIGAGRVQLPEGANGCQIDSPDRDECLRATIERMIPRLSKGYPSLNIPPLDPLNRQATLYEYKSGPLRVLMSAKDTAIYGLSRSQLTNVRTDITDVGMSTEIDMFFPRLFMTSSYKADSTYEGLQFNSQGKLNITFSGMRTTQKMSGRFVNRDGEKFLHLEHFDIDIINLDDFKFSATGLFPDPELTQMAVTFVNTYWKALYRSIVPMTKSSWEPLLVRECNDFLRSIPYDTMLYYGPEDN